MNKLQHALADSGAEPRSVPERWSAGELVQTKRAGSHQVGRVLIGLVGLVVLLGVVGAVYESVAEAADARAYPAPGRMVDVGGYRLHVNCLGTGSPTVVIDSGLGDWSASWRSWVQPEAAKATRVCTYDRAGIGYSEPGPLPRTAAHFAQELHTLLQHADIPGPYVLVGHSAGGLTVRVFADAYPAEVVGVVLIDSMSPTLATQAAPSTPPDGRTSERVVDRHAPGADRLAAVVGRATPDEVRVGAGGSRRLRRVLGDPAFRPDDAGREHGAGRRLEAGGRRHELRRCSPDCAVTWTGSASGLAAAADRAPPLVLQ